MADQQHAISPRGKQSVTGILSEMAAALTAMAETRTDKAAGLQFDRWKAAYRSLADAQVSRVPDVIKKLVAVKAELAKQHEGEGGLEQTDIEIIGSAIADLQRMVSGDTLVARMAARMAELVVLTCEAAVGGGTDRDRNEFDQLASVASYVTPQNLDDIVVLARLAAGHCSCAGDENINDEVRTKAGADGLAALTGIMAALTGLGATEPAPLTRYYPGGSEIALPEDEKAA
jgi:hypothetical protein